MKRKKREDWKREIKNKNRDSFQLGLEIWTFWKHFLIFFLVQNSFKLSELKISKLCSNCSTNCKAFYHFFDYLWKTKKPFWFVVVFPVVFPNRASGWYKCQAFSQYSLCNRNAFSETQKSSLLFIEHTERKYLLQKYRHSLRSFSTRGLESLKSWIWFLICKHYLESLRMHFQRKYFLKINPKRNYKRFI